VSPARGVVIGGCPCRLHRALAQVAVVEVASPSTVSIDRAVKPVMRPFAVELGPADLTHRRGNTFADRCCRRPPDHRAVAASQSHVRNRDVAEQLGQLRLVVGAHPFAGGSPSGRGARDRDSTVFRPDRARVAGAASGESTGRPIVSASQRIDPPRPGCCASQAVTPRGVASDTRVASLAMPLVRSSSSSWWRGCQVDQAQRTGCSGSSQARQRWSRWGGGGVSLRLSRSERVMTRRMTVRRGRSNPITRVACG
jgi:hypothetical protein